MTTVEVMQRSGFPNEVMRVKAEEIDITETESNESGDHQQTFTSERNDTDKSGTANSGGADANHITKPGTHDVLLGRGGGTNNHSGNIKFRKLVNEHKMRYLACSKVEKPKVAREVVAIWRKLDPPGRFLARKDDTKRGPGSVKSTDNVWYEVGDKKAREKASQCLRERTPDVIPYIKHLREQQNAITEHGVSMVQMQMQQHDHQQYSSGRPGRQMMHSPMHPGQGFGNYMDPYGSNPHMTHHRRNSAPGQYGNPMPVPPYAPSYSPPPSLRRSNTVNPSGPYDHEPDASEIEYQQQMAMMHQNMMHQQMEMQRLQNSHQTDHRGGRGGVYDVAPSSPKEEDREPPLTVSGSEESPKKRSRNVDDGDKRTAPDRAISAMSLTPANPNDNELSLEDYRQQLEEYIANCNTEDGEASDLEDDWEKERDRALKQHQETSKSRGVNRNVSGISAFSNKSAAAMSLVSGFSGFSDMLKENGRENKMNLSRSVCSNLSLMSELTDLSHNIDNLSLYDD